MVTNFDKFKIILTNRVKNFSITARFTVTNDNRGIRASGWASSGLYLTKFLRIFFQLNSISMLAIFFICFQSTECSSKTKIIYRTPRKKQLSINSYILSDFSYCFLGWFNIFKKLLNNIEKLEKRAVRFHQRVYLSFCKSLLELFGKTSIA